MAGIEQDLEKASFCHLVLPKLLLLASQRPVFNLRVHKRQELDFFQTSEMEIVEVRQRQRSREKQSMPTLSQILRMGGHYFLG